MKTAYVGMATAVLGGALGQLLMKLGLQSLPFGDYGAMLKSLLYNQGAALFIIAGIFSYVVSMIVWVHALKNTELNKAYPVLSLGYVVVYLAAAFWPGLQEPLTIQKTLGITFIIFGVWITQFSIVKEDV